MDRPVSERRPILPKSSASSEQTDASPRAFLEVRVQDVATNPGLVGLCAGYQSGRWRAEELAKHMLEWLPEFALTHSERQALGAHNAVRLIGKAAKAIYASTDPSKRGEPGELLLHLALRQVFNTVPAISKLYYKDSRNDTVKGFDAVHVVATDSSLQLWLGEAKFYVDITRAIDDVVTELHKHTQQDYLRDEFAAIVNKIDDHWPHASKLKGLLDKNTTLDKVFDCACFPAFLTYESPTLAVHSKVTKAFCSAFEKEVRQHHACFLAKALPTLRIYLILLPMVSKSDLMSAFDSRVQACQMLD